MARILSPSSMSLLFPPTLSQKSIFPAKSFAFSTKPMQKARFSGKPHGPLLFPAASSAAAPVVPDDIADLLGEVSIFTAAGDRVRFNELWDQQEGVAVVALLRHFGCFCCCEFAAALKEAKENFDSAGVKLIAVGVGTPDKDQLLTEKLPFPLDSLYADPDHKAYNVLGLYYGFGRTSTQLVLKYFQDLSK